jgi:hypothetical protein
MITRLIDSITKKIPEKRCFYGDFPLFVLQLSWFKTYPHADAKQRKTKKWPKPFGRF